MNMVPENINVLIPAPLRRVLRSVYDRALCFGFRYKCPYCYAMLRTFQPYGFKIPVLEEKQVIGGGYRQNAFCPICYSVDRERLLYLYLRNQTDIFQRPQKVLHVAPEKKLEETLKKRKNLDYITADLYSENVMVTMDITNIQYSDHTFDAILCNHVLEHVSDDRKAMSELFRTLRPGGWAILQVPLSLTLEKTCEDDAITDPGQREKAFGQEDHVRIYARDYKERLEQVGFKVVLFDWTRAGKRFGAPGNRYGLIKEERVYVAKKEA